MKEIRFRAWDGYTSRMYNWAKLGEMNEKNYLSLWNCLIGEVKTITLMQYTGLKDKNGKMIYENDILLFDPDVWGSDEGIFQVEWDEKNARFVGYGTAEEWPKYCTIIGNIYENPELINPKDCTAKTSLDDVFNALRQCRPDRRK